MDDHSTDTPAAPPALEPPPEGTVHPGAGPRLRRAGRTAAILGVVAFAGLLTFLSAKYSHDIGRPTTAEESAPASVPTTPLSAERIEELARRHLRDQLRASKPAPPPPLFDASPEPELPRTEVVPPRPAAPRPRAAGPSPARRALEAPLVPAVTGAPAPAAPRDPRTGGDPRTPASQAFPSFEEFLAGAPTPYPPARPSGPPLTAGASGNLGSGISAAPEPLDRRSEIDPPAPGPLTLRPVAAPTVPTLYARTTIPLVLTHAVSTDVAAPVRAYVTRDVYDSLDGEVLVVPRGTLAIGYQAAHAAAGDERILIYWTELKLPSGLSYRLPTLLGGSQDGTAGVRGDVDNHWWGRLGSAIGLSLVGAGIQLSQPQERTSVQGFAPDESQVLAQQLGLELGRLSQEILRRGVNRPPTITLRPGERVSLLLTRDLAFAR